MKKRLVSAAAILAFLCFLVHTFVGTREVQGPLLQSNLALDTKVLFLVCWHIVTLTLLASAWILFRLRGAEATPTHTTVLRALGVSWIGFGLLFPLTAMLLGGMEMIPKFPQVTLIAPVGILCLLAIPSKQANP